MALKFHIKNGTLYDPSHYWEHTADIFIADTKIIGIGHAPADFTPDRTIDASGLWILPGLVDLAAQITPLTEVTAAVKGGITTLCSLPPLDSPTAVYSLAQAAQQLDKCTILPLAALTQHTKGEHLSELAALKNAGCVAATNDVSALTNTRVLRQCFQYAKTLEMPVLLTAFDEFLCQDGSMHEGFTSTRLGLKGIPATAEAIAVAKALFLQQETGVRLHFCRISTSQSVDLIAQAKQRGQAVTADVAIHHLILTDLDVDGFNPNARVFPPLRPQQDQLALIRGLAEGTLDAICSDHRPLRHSWKTKPFPETEPGISGMETLLYLALQLEKNTVLSRRQIISLLTCSPAAVIGSRAGRLEDIYGADLVLFNPLLSWQINAQSFLSQGQNTPFNDWWVEGQIIVTFVKGKMVYQM